MQGSQNGKKKNEKSFDAPPVVRLTELGHCFFNVGLSGQPKDIARISPPIVKGASLPARSGQQKRLTLNRPSAGLTSRGSSLCLYLFPGLADGDLSLTAPLPLPLPQVDDTYLPSYSHTHDQHHIYGAPNSYILTYQSLFQHTFFCWLKTGVQACRCCISVDLG